MAKTVREIAEEIGVTKPAIHQRRKQEPLKSYLQSFTKIVNNTVYIDDEGVTLIKQAFSRETVNESVNEGKIVNETVNETVNELERAFGMISILQGELDVKNEQIESQQQTISDLTSALQNMTETLCASQALHAGTIQSQLEEKSRNVTGVPLESTQEKQDDKEGAVETQEKSSGGFWGRLFRR